MKKNIIIPPNFVFEEYFNGRVKATGQFKNYFLKTKVEYLQADFFGTFKNNIITIKEEFKSSIKKPVNRLWTFSKITKDEYIGREKNIAGLITAKSELNMFTMKYNFLIKVKNIKVSLKICDKMYLYEKNYLVNRSVIKKFGFTIGEIVMLYTKKN